MFLFQLIRALVVQENENGKLFVELFDAETGASLNKLLIQRGLADPASSTGVDGNERDETASVISVPRHAKQGKLLFVVKEKPFDGQYEKYFKNENYDFLEVSRL